MKWLTANWSQVLELTLDHLLLCAPAIVISVLVAVPIGRIAWRFPRWGRPMAVIATLLYAVPALPLLIVIPAILGTPLRSTETMVVALSVYGVALLVGTSTDAFASVDPVVREAAVAIGHSSRGVFWRVDLPLAIPVLLSGIRVVVVSTIGLVTIGALIGVPSLGSLLTDGFQRGITAEVIAGVAAPVVLALMLDGLLLVGGRALMPWSRQRVPNIKNSVVDARDAA